MSYFHGRLPTIIGAAAQHKISTLRAALAILIPLIIVLILLVVLFAAALALLAASGGFSALAPVTG